MAYSKVIGKIAIKVIPDTSKFRDDLLGELRQIERTTPAVKVKATLDDKLTDDVARAAKAAQAAAKKHPISFEFNDRSYEDLQRAIDNVNSQLREAQKNAKFDLDVEDPASLAQLKNDLRELQEISHLEVKFVEDERGYRDLLGKLKAIQRERLTVEFDMRLDDEAIARQIEELEDKLRLEAQITEERGSLEKLHRKIQEDLGRTKIEIPIDLNNEELRAEINRLQQTLELKVDMEEAAERLQKIGDQALSKLKMSLDRVSYDEVEQRLQDMRDKWDGTELDFQVAVDSLVARAELARVSRDRFVNLHVKVSQASLRAAQQAIAALSGARLLGSTLDNLRALFENIDKNVPLIGSLALAVQGLSAWLLAAASNTFALSRNLAQIGGVALALPGLLAGVGIGIGAAVAVLKDFNAELPGIKESFSGLQDIMSSTFWSTARGPIRDFIDTIFPELSAGLITTSGALGVFAAALSGSLSEHFDDGAMRAMFANLADSILIASEGTDAWSQAIEILGRRGSEYLPRLAQWVNDLGDRFRDWLELADQDGRLTGWIETGITQARELGRALGGLGGILTDIAQAAERGGGSTLTMLADTLERVEKITDGDAFKNGLVRVLDGAHKAMSNIANESGPAVTDMFRTLSFTLAESMPIAGEAIGKLAEGVAELLGSTGMQSGIVDLFTSLREALETLSPMWGPVGEGLGGILTLIGSLAEGFAPLLVTLLTGLSDIVLALAPGISNLSETLSGLLNGVLSTGLGILTTFAEVFGGFLAAISTNPVGAAAVAGAVLAVAGAFRGAAVAVGLYNAALSSGFIANTGSITGNIAAIKSELVKLTTNAKFARVALMGIGTGLALGMVGAAALAIGTLGTSVSNLGVQQPAIDDMVAGIENLGRAGSDAKLGQMFQGTESAFSWLAMAPGQDLNNLATDVRSLGDAFSYTQQWADANWWDKIWNSGDSFGGLGAHSAALNQSKEALLAFDQAAQQIVASGNQAQIAELQAYIAEEMATAGISTQEMAQKLPLYAQGIEHAALAQEQQADAAANAARELVGYQDAIADIGGITPGMVHAIEEGAKAFFNLGQDIADAELSFDGWITSLEEQVAAQREWADNMVTLAKAGVSEGVLAELSKLGPESALRVQEMVDAIAKDDTGWIDTLNEVFVQGTGRAVDGFGQALSGLQEQLDGALVGLNVTNMPSSFVSQLEEQGAVIVDGIVTGFGSANLGAQMTTKVQDAINGLQGPGIDYSLPHSLITALKLMGVEIPETIAAGLDGAPGYLGTAVQDALIEWNVSSLPPETIAMLESLGFDIVDGVIEGINTQASALDPAAALMAGNVVRSFAGAMQIQSPSRVMAALGRFVVEGLIEGLLNIGGLADAVLGLAGLIVSTFTGADPGGNLVASFLDRVITLLPSVTSTGDVLGRMFRTGVAAVPMASAAVSLVTSLVNGLSGLGSTAKTAGTALANSARAGAAGVSMQAVGNTLALTFINGVGGNAGLAATIGGALASAAVAAMAGYSAWSSGYAVGKTFADGLDATKGMVREAGRGLAAAARASLPNSPAKEGPFSGSGWGGWGESIADELASGMTSRTSAVRHASDRMMRAVDLTHGETGALSSGRGGQRPSVTVNADVKDLAGIRSLEELVLMAETWSRQS